MRTRRRPVERENRIFGAITFVFFIFGLIAWLGGELSGQTNSGGKLMVIFFLCGVVPLSIYLFKNRKHR